MSLCVLRSAGVCRLTGDPSERDGIIAGYHFEYLLKGRRHHGVARIGHLTLSFATHLDSFRNGGLHYAEKSGCAAEVYPVGKAVTLKDEEKRNAN